MGIYLSLCPESGYSLSYGTPGLSDTRPNARINTVYLKKLNNDEGNPTGELVELEFSNGALFQFQQAGNEITTQTHNAGLLPTGLYCGESFLKICREMKLIELRKKLNYHSKLHPEFNIRLSTDSFVYQQIRMEMQFIHRPIVITVSKFETHASMGVPRVLLLPSLYRVPERCMDKELFYLLESFGAFTRFTEFRSFVEENGAATVWLYDAKTKKCVCTSKAECDIGRGDTPETILIQAKRDCLVKLVEYLTFTYSLGE